MLATALTVSSLAMADEQHWSYEGDDGPTHWGGLCNSGKNQSPVDLRDAVSAKLAPLSFKYQSLAQDVFNNGHTVQVTYAPGSELTVDSHRYQLKQFHFHAPSEDLLNGKRFPLEAHFVHADEDGNLAVVAVFVEEGAANAALEKLGKDLPVRAGDKHDLVVKVAAAELMPKTRDYYRFSGSLTTPPCSEGVNWLVLKHPITASEEQIEHLHAAMGHDNARPVQPLNARIIVK
ncbi:carbonic anhydrase [Steroidobacter sp.]|uniref:carbonic anhydrase n=1 Tax=Steroidobacter sp. TaxID=1978227 RepID=UPI0039C9A499